MVVEVVAVPLLSACAGVGITGVFQFVLVRSAACLLRTFVREWKKGTNRQLLLLAGHGCLAGLGVREASELG